MGKTFNSFVLSLVFALTFTGCKPNTDVGVNEDYAFLDDIKCVIIFSDNELSEKLDDAAKDTSYITQVLSRNLTLPDSNVAPLKDGDNWYLISVNACEAYDEEVQHTFENFFNLKELTLSHINPASFKQIYIDNDTVTEIPALPTKD